MLALIKSRTHLPLIGHLVLATLHSPLSLYQPLSPTLPTSSSKTPQDRGPVVSLSAAMLLKLPIVRPAFLRIGSSVPDDNP